MINNDNNNNMPKALNGVNEQSFPVVKFSGRRRCEKAK